VLPTAASMSSKKKGGVQEGQLAKMLERQRVHQAAADTAKKLADAAADAAKFSVKYKDDRATGKAHRTQVREWMGGWSDQGL
jgi:hypothetical protein